MTGGQFISEPCAVITGPGAYLLSQLLSTPQVRDYRRSAPWTQTVDIEAAIGAIHAAGRAWQTTIELPQRHPTPRSGRTIRHRATMSTVTTDEAAAILHLSRRRVEELAKTGAIAGHRNGQRWRLDRGSVTAYHHRRNGS